MKSSTTNFFTEATKKLSIAKEELLKPEKDIVSFSVCKNSQFAIENYLKGYLVKKNVSFNQDETLSTLYKKCLNIDENFKKLDLASLGCKEYAIDSRYCSEINSVSACFDTADAIDTYFRKIGII